MTHADPVLCSQKVATLELTAQLLSETPELPIANIGGRTWGGALAPTKFNAGGQCPHKILQWQVHYSGARGRPISQEVTYVA